MLSLKEFIKTHGAAAMRIARSDEVFNECLVLKFKEYMKSYDPSVGTPEGYVLMRLRYAVLKYLYNERQWQRKHGELLAEATQPVHHPDLTTALEKAMCELDPDLLEAIEWWSNGYTHHEISQLLGIHMRKVRARINAAITVLRRELDNALRTQDLE